MLIGRVVLYLRSRHQESIGHDEFLALGLIALAFGAATLSHASGFLAVFAAGLALQRVKLRPAATDRSVAAQPMTDEERATHPSSAVAFMMQEVQGFNERLERIAEVVVVLVAGAMLAYVSLPPGVGWLLVLLFAVVRPVAVWLGLLGTQVSRDQRLLISWFGIRGIGSIYYLMYAINHGLSPQLAAQITACTLTVVAASIVLHGISVTPLMALYARRRERRKRPRQSA
jgi:NhaP-type Na+/H+ or K+/H+ antiporter